MRIMIELNRFIRLKPDGLTRVEATAKEGGGVNVYFKRFDVETGKEIEPETSFLSFSEIDLKVEEMERHLAALREFSRLKPS